MFNWSSFIMHLTKSLLGRFYELQIDQVSEHRQNTRFPSSSYLTKCLGVCDSSECVKVGFWSWIWKFMHLNTFFNKQRQCFVMGTFDMYIYYNFQDL